MRSVHRQQHAGDEFSIARNEKQRGVSDVPGASHSALERDRCISSLDQLFFIITVDRLMSSEQCNYLVGKLAGWKKGLMDSLTEVKR